MNKKIKIVSLGFVIAILAIIGGFKYYSGTSVATVNGEKITKSEFKTRVGVDIAKAQISSNKKIEEKERTAIKKSTLDKMIEEKTLIQAAKKEKFYPAEEDSLNKEADKTMSELQADKTVKEKLEKAFKENGIAEKDYKNNIKLNLIMDKIQGAIMAKAVVTDEVAKKYYEENKRKFAEKPSKFNISIIVVKDQQTMKEVLGKLNAKESFEDLAKQYSTDPSTKEKGGLLGEVELKAETMDNKLASVANQLKVGEFSTGDSFKGAYYLVKLNSRIDSNIKPFETIKEEVKKDSNLVDSVKFGEYQKKCTQLKKDAKIVINKQVIDSIK